MSWHPMPGQGRDQPQAAPPLGPSWLPQSTAPSEQLAPQDTLLPSSPPQFCCRTLAGARHHLQAIIYLQAGDCLEDRSNWLCHLPHPARTPGTRATPWEGQAAWPSRDPVHGKGTAWFCPSALCWRRHLVQTHRPEHST